MPRSADPTTSGRRSRNGITTMATQKTRRRTPTQSQRRSACLSATTAAQHSTLHPHDLPAADPSATKAPAPSATGWIRSSHRLLMMRGLSRIEAGNVVAYVAGLHATENGWSVRQIEQLVALRSLVACGVIAS